MWRFDDETKVGMGFMSRFVMVGRGSVSGSRSGSGFW